MTKSKHIVLPGARGYKHDNGPYLFTERSNAERMASQALTYALTHYPAFNSPHEAYGVLAEEVMEALDAIHKNEDVDAFHEFAQIAAVSMKAMMMLRQRILISAKKSRIDL